MFCLKCGKELEDSAMSCPFCGCATENAGVSIQSADIDDSFKSAESLANIGFIFGVIGIVAAWLLAIFGYICGGAALGLAFYAKSKNANSPKIKKAMLFGGIALACSVVSSIIGIILMS